MKLSIILASLFLGAICMEAAAQSTALSVTDESVTSIVPKDNSTINSESNEVLVYPNPATEVLNLSWSNDVEMIELSDSKGRLLNRFFVGTMKDLKINLTPYSNGIYFIHVTSDVGISVRSIVKE